MRARHDIEASAIETATAVEAPRPLKFTQVAFAGHNRPEDLGDPALALSGLTRACAMLRQAGVTEARLVTGLAPGADQLAAGAWKAAGLGPVHAVFPFLDDTVEGDAAGLMDCGAWLDGQRTEAAGRNPYLAQTRWLIGAADLLVVVWTGTPARGAGGTADAVRLALENNVPVLWIDPKRAGEPHLIRPEHLAEDFGFLEFLEQLRFSRAPLVQVATAPALREALIDIGLRADPPREAARPDIASATRPERRWRAYALFRRTLGGKAAPFNARPVPPDLAADPGFAALTRAQVAADEEASQLGAIHRSQQVILLGVAILAAIAGSAAAVWSSIKLAMVSLEILLAIGAFVVWLDSERGRRHQRWGAARRLAEDLRLERVAWVLGVSATPQGALFASSAQARQVRREAGLPRAMFNAERVASWGAWAVDELLAGQAAYHRGQSTINGRISQRIHQVENTSFAVLMIVLVAYVVDTLGLSVLGEKTPRWLSQMVEVAGTIVPAIGAACLALEATLSLSEQAERGRVLAVRLESIIADIVQPAGLDAYQAAAKAAIRLQRAEENHWAEGASRRRLLRGN